MLQSINSPFFFMFDIFDGITVLPWESNDVVYINLDCQAKTTAEFNRNLVILASPIPRSL